MKIDFKSKKTIIIGIISLLIVLGVLTASGKIDFGKGQASILNFFGISKKSTPSPSAQPSSPQDTSSDLSGQIAPVVDENIVLTKETDSPQSSNEGEPTQVPQNEVSPPPANIVNNQNPPISIAQEPILPPIVGFPQGGVGGFADETVLSVSVPPSTLPVNPDTQAPTVSIISPADGSTVSLNFDATAEASDNVGVTEVQFSIDGADFGAQLVAAPYQISIDSLALIDGLHQIAARARDSAGNSASSSAISINVKNAINEPNLILNPSLEEAGQDNSPAYWNRGSWGTNDASFFYPVDGQDGVFAAKVTISSYTDGDAKWYFDEVVIEPNVTYLFSDWYKSNLPSGLTARYTFPDSSIVYEQIISLPSSEGNWLKASQEITAMPLAVSLTIFHYIQGAGELSVDNFSLTKVHLSADEIFAEGMVSLSFDDGWASQFENALPILTAQNLKGTFCLISGETANTNSSNLVANPSLEEAGAGSEPAFWHSDPWGTNDASFFYPVAGYESAAAAKVTISSYTDGDGKWYFDDVPVVPGEQYHFKDWYLATASSTITVRFATSSDSFFYDDYAYLSPSASWQQAEFYFVVPQGVSSITVLHLLAGIGELTIDNVSLEGKRGPSPNIDSSQMLAMQVSGHEICSHSKTHVSLPPLPLDQAQAEIQQSKSYLSFLGALINTFAYPYGDYSDAIKNLVKDAGYIAGRSVDSGYNKKTTDKFALKVQSVLASTTPETIKSWIDKAVQDKTWLILVFHQIDDQGNPYGTTPQILSQVVSYLKDNNISVKTLSEGVSLMNP